MKSIREQFLEDAEESNAAEWAEKQPEDAAWLMSRDLSGNRVFFGPYKNMAVANAAIPSSRSFAIYTISDMTSRWYMYLDKIKDPFTLDRLKLARTGGNLRPSRPFVKDPSGFERPLKLSRK